MAIYFYTPFHYHPSVGATVDSPTHLDLDGYSAALLRDGCKVDRTVIYRGESLAHLVSGDSLYVIGHSDNASQTLFAKPTSQGRGEQMTANDVVWALVKGDLPNVALDVHVFGCLTGVRGPDSTTFAARVASALGAQGFQDLTVTGYVGFTRSGDDGLEVVKKIRSGAGGGWQPSHVKRSTQRAVVYNTAGLRIQGTEGVRTNRTNGATQTIRIHNA